MDQYTLVKEIIKTCKFFKIMDSEINDNLVEKKIIDGLNDIIFVENLLNVFYKKMKFKKFQKYISIDRIKRLLIELEKIRLNLEFKGGGI